jgi:hypothetical protein
MPLLLDDSRWPLVVDTSSGQLSDEDIRRYNAARAERLARGERHFQVMDGRGGMRMAPRHREMIAAFDRQNREARQRYVAGVALVTASAALRLILTALYRLTRSVYPRRAFKTPDEAAAWGRDVLNACQSPCSASTGSIETARRAGR